MLSSNVSPFGFGPGMHFGPSDSGSKTIPGMYFTDKMIYSEYATYDAVDHERQIAGQLKLQGLRDMR